MRIAHGLFLWQEPRQVLEPCLRSVVPWVDEVIVAEGLIEGVPDLGLGSHTDLAWLADPSDFLPDRIHISSRGGGRDNVGQTPWPTLSAACTWILKKAQSLDCDWLLYIDADQELHNGPALRDWLGFWGNMPAPIRRCEPSGAQMCVPWQLIPTGLFARYVAGCYLLETRDGRTVNLVPPGPRDPWPLSAPWISHHPERRPPWRRSQRLGSFETILEPPPLQTSDPSSIFAA